MIEYKVIVHGNGKVFWLNKEGEYHREGDLPAIAFPDGFKAYFINGKLTREKGPAFIDVDGSEEYWINDVQLTKKEFEARSDPKPKHEGRVVTVDGVEYELKAKN